MTSRFIPGAMIVALTLPAALLAQQRPPLPLKHAPQPTTAAPSAADLMTRLYIFADDSMQGRETGTVGHLKSTAYIARELKRLGVQPGGDEGSYFQEVPMVRRGTAADTTDLPSHDQIAGKIVVLESAPGGGPGGGRPGGRGGFAALRAWSDAAAIVMVTDALSPAAVQAAVHPREGDVMLNPDGNGPASPITITMTSRAAQVLLGTGDGSRFRRA